MTLKPMALQFKQIISIISNAAIVALVVAGFTGASKTYAQSQTSALHYAGFAFEGNYDERAKRYKTLAQLVETNKLDPNTLIIKKINSTPETTQKISLSLADIKSDPVMVAFAITQETQETQKIDNQYWMIVVVQANVLAFHKSSNSVVASFPVRLRLTRASATPPTPEQLNGVVAEAFLSTNPNENIIDLWVQKLLTSTFHEGAIKRIRVASINITPEAHDVFQKSGVEESAIKASIASNLEASLSETAGISLIPNTIGELGNIVALRFSDSSIQIKLPITDYDIFYTVRGFATATTESQAAFIDVYRAKVNFQIKSSEGEKTYINEDLFETKFVTRSKQMNISLGLWEQYFKTLQEQINGMGVQLVGVKDDWLKDHASKGVDAKNGFLSANQLMKELK